MSLLSPSFIKRRNGQCVCRNHGIVTYLMNAQCHGSRYGGFGVDSGELTVTEQVFTKVSRI